MSWPIRQAWHRVRVRTRIAAAIVVALASVLALAILQFLLAPRPERVLYDSRWLADASVEAAVAAFAKPPTARDGALQVLPAARWLLLRWQREAPPFAGEPAGREHPVGQRLETALAGMLRGYARSVIVSFAFPGPVGGPPEKVVLRPPGSDGRPRPAVSGNHRTESTAQAPGQALPPPDEMSGGLPPRVGGAEMHPIPPFFRIAIEGPDGTWLAVLPSQDAEAGLPWSWPLLPLIGGTLAIAAISAFTARRILMPLDELTTAARRLGTERNPAPIASVRLGEFSAIALAFNDMQDRLNRFIGDRTLMLAAISHDLRTSLTRLKLAIEGFEDGDRKHLATREIDEMSAMISATLSFASADAEAEASRDIDLATVLISLCDDASDHGGCIEYLGPDHAMLRCQPVAMKRALMNIVDNAMKYGRKAAVSLEVDHAFVVIRVADDGPGIAPEQIEEAFAPFRRLEPSRNRATGGVGLGLTIARDVVQAHGGTISLGSGVPRGLVATITLPAGV